MPTFIDDLETIQKQLGLLAEALRDTPFADSAALLRAQGAADRSVLKMALATEKKKRQEAEEDARMLRARTALLDACRARPWRNPWAENDCLGAGAGAGAGGGAGGEAPTGSAPLAALARLLARNSSAECAAVPLAAQPEVAEPATQATTPEVGEGDGDEDLYS